MTVTGRAWSPKVRPPSTEVGVVGWLYHNLFNSKLNGLSRSSSGHRRWS